MYPTLHSEVPDKTRSTLLIRSHISTDNWNQIDFPSSDITVIQLSGKWGKLTIFNIYNNGNSNKTINSLTKFHKNNHAKLGLDEPWNAHIIWLGDFNRHHPHWDDPSDTRLFSKEALKVADMLIDVVAEAGLVMALPSGTPTHYHNVTKRWSRLNQVFLSEHSENLLIACDTQTEHRGVKTDHLSILTELNIEANTNKEKQMPNFRKVNWDEFGKSLDVKLLRA